MKQITEKQGVHKQWYVDARSQTVDTLPDFINGLMTEYGHDYGTICHAVAASAIAAANAVNNHKKGGITGFQAGAVMWEFIRHWNYESNKVGLRIVDYDNLLYPQYEDEINKRTITSHQHKELKKQAEILLSERGGHERVRAHCQKIVDGWIPFGFVVQD